MMTCDRDKAVVAYYFKRNGESNKHKKKVNRSDFIKPIFREWFFYLTFYFNDSLFLSFLISLYSIEEVDILKLTKDTFLLQKVTKTSE